MNDDQPRGLDELLDLLPTPEPPPALKGKVMYAVRARPRATLARRWVPLALGAAAVCAVTFLRPAGPEPIAVGRDDLQVEALISYHAAALTANPLADPAAMVAIGADAARRGVGGH